MKWRGQMLRIVNNFICEYCQKCHVRIVDFFFAIIVNGALPTIQNLLEYKDLGIG